MAVTTRTAVSLRSQPGEGGRWAHYSQVRLYPVRRALRRIQHRVIELESRHRDRLPRRVYLTTELSFCSKTR